MNSNNRLTIALLFLTSVTIILSYSTKIERPVNNEVVINVITKEDSIAIRMNEIADSIEKVVDNNFEYIYPRFKVFNPNVDSSIVRTFAGVMNSFKLDETKYMREMYTGQILLESGAKQYRANGDLVLSPVGAVGLCQIMPNTCSGYMRRYVDSADRVLFNKLGASKFSFAYNDTLSRKEKNLKAKEWLTNVNNNIIMWGYITRNNLNRKGDLHKQLVAYNAGTSGMRRYVTNGGDCNRHEYLCGIRSKLAVASR
jgi:hypothetical protein